MGFKTVRKVVAGKVVIRMRGSSVIKKVPRNKRAGMRYAPNDRLEASAIKKIDALMTLGEKEAKYCTNFVGGTLRNSIRRIMEGRIDPEGAIEKLWEGPIAEINKMRWKYRKEPITQMELRVLILRKLKKAFEKSPY